MRRFAISVLGLVLLTFGFAAAAADGQAKGPQRAVVVFNEPVKLLGVILKGEYIFVHDEEKMAQGQDCTYVYTREDGKQGRLVTSFHCIPIEREPVDHFTVMVGSLDPVSHLPELLEYRFAGSTEGHQVPRPAALRP